MTRFQTVNDAAPLLRSKHIAFSFFSCLYLLLFPALLIAQDELNTSISPPEFSQEGGFYTASFSLSLSTENSEDIILYTLDGSVPLPENLEGAVYSYKNSYPESPGDPFGEMLFDTMFTYVYNSALSIEDRSGQPDRISQKSTTYTFETNYFPSEPSFKGTVVRARSWRPGEGYSEVKSQTCFVTPEGSARYGIPVISLVLDEEGLFDYFDGIAVAGAMFDTFRTAFPDATVLPVGQNNFSRSGRETERETAFSLFYPEQSAPVLHQDVGLRLHGSSSRRWPRKSFRLYARNEYGTSSFDHPLFGPSNDASFKRIILHNAGGDQQKANMRDAVIQRIFEPLGLYYLDAQPSVIFVNGEYYGVNTVRERYDHHYFERKQGIEEANLEMYKDGEIDYGNDLHLNFVTDFTDQNPATDENLQIFEALVDASTLRDAFIAGIYSRNSDWLRNNTLAWRSKVIDAQNDGRWRLALIDLDQGWANRDGLTAIEDDYLSVILNDTDNKDGVWADRWRWAMENEKFRNDFINRTADCINTFLLPGNAAATVTQYAQIIAPYMAEHSARWRRPSSMNAWLGEITDMLTFSQERPAYHLGHIESAFDLSGQFELNLEVSDEEAGYIKINTIDVKAGTPGVSDNPYPWNGTYFRGVPVRITAVPEAGYAFSHWEGDTQAAGSSFKHAFDEGEVLVKAVFTQLSEVSEPAEEEVFLYWHFNGLPGVFNAVLSDFSLETQGEITYPGTGNGFLDDVNDGSEINLQYGQPAGRGLRVRNPSDTRYLLIEAPTEGYSNIRLDYAAKRTGNGAKFQELEYRTAPGQPWTAFAADSVYEDYTAYSFDFTGVDGADDNPGFAVRIKFTDSAAANSSGNNRFDNISFSGLPTAPASGTHHILADSDFTFSAWGLDETPGTSPDFMQFWWSENPSGPAYDEFTAGSSAYDCGFDLDSRPRINGLSDQGFSFISTGNPQFNDCNGGPADSDRYVGSASVNLNTEGIEFAEMSWVNRLVTAGARQFAVRLQYRIGNVGPYQDFDIPVTFSSAGKTEGQAVSFLIELPDILLGHEAVSLRYLYFQEAGKSGNRPEIAVDDIIISAESAATPLLTASEGTLSGFFYNEGQGPSAAVTYTFSGTGLSPETGAATVLVPPPFEASLAGAPYSGQFEIPYTGGEFSAEINVRMAAGFGAGVYSGLPLIHVGGGATPLSLQISGEVGYPINLAPGDVSVIGFRSVANDGFSFVNWVNLPEETVLIFTDKGWTGEELLDNENALVWKNTTGAAIPAGTVTKIGGPEFGDGEGTDAGEILSGSMDGLSQNGDNIFVIQGGVQQPAWIYGLSYLSEWLTEGEVTNPTSYLPDALDIPFGNIVIHALNSEYDDARSGESSFDTYRNFVHIADNWRIDNDGAGFGDFNTAPFVIGPGGCNADGGTITPLGAQSVCVGTGTAQTVSIQLTGAAGTNGRWGLLDSQGNILANRISNSLFNLDGYAPGNYRIRYLSYEDDVSLSGLNNQSDLSSLQGCWDASNSVTLYLRPKPEGGTLTALTPTTVCSASGASTSISVEVTGAEGFGSRFALLNTPQNGGNLLAASTSGGFNLNPYPNGTYRIRHLSYQEGVSLAGVTGPSDLQGCYDASNAVMVTIVNCSGAELSSSPNPTSGVSTATFKNPDEGHATLEIFDMSGRKIKQLFGQNTSPDITYSVDFDGSDLPNGVYLYRLTTASEVVTEKLLISK